MRRTVASATAGNEKRKYWSADVTRKSNALDLEPGLFTWKDPRRIAESLKRSAQVSERRKGTPLQSAMSMLNFYINRAGTNLDSAQRRILEDAKEELRELFKRQEQVMAGPGEAVQSAGSSPGNRCLPLADKG